MAERTGVLCGGNWIIDHVKMIDTYPEQDALASILGQSEGTGGAPYNVLIDLAKLGAPFPLSGVGLVGDDEDGNTILTDCERFGIDAAQVHRTVNAGTSFTDVMTVQSTGRRTFFHMRGANSLLSEEHFDLEASNARIFHIGYILLLDALDVIAEDGTTGIARLLKRARELGFKTAVDIVSEDSDRFVSVVTPSLPHIDYLIVNEFEASRSTGIEIMENGEVSLAKAAEAAQALLDLGVHEWVVIHCPSGALALSKDGEKALQGSVDTPTEQIVGTAGAGDAFAAGMLFGLHEGRDIQACLRMGACAADTNLTDATCTGGIKPMTECLQRGERRGFNTI
jgi:sugar/nucleoside kinase (ribokinase family)